MCYNRASISNFFHVRQFQSDYHFDFLSKYTRLPEPPQMHQFFESPILFSYFDEIILRCAVILNYNSKMAAIDDNLFVCWFTICIPILVNYPSHLFIFAIIFLVWQYYSIPETSPLLHIYSYFPISDVSILLTLSREVFFYYEAQDISVLGIIFLPKTNFEKKPYFFCFLSTRDFYELLSRYKRNLIICIQYEYPVVCWCSHYCTAPYIPI